MLFFLLYTFLLLELALTLLLLRGALAVGECVCESLVGDILRLLLALFEIDRAFLVFANDHAQAPLLHQSCLLDVCVAGLR